MWSCRTFRGSDGKSSRELYLESFISNLCPCKAPISGHFVEVMKIGEHELTCSYLVVV